MHYGNLKLFCSWLVYRTSPEMYFPSCVIGSLIFPEVCPWHLSNFRHPQQQEFQFWWDTLQGLHSCGMQNPAAFLIKKQNVIIMKQTLQHSDSVCKGHGEINSFLFRATKGRNLLQGLLKLITLIYIDHPIVELLFKKSLKGPRV